MSKGNLKKKPAELFSYGEIEDSISSEEEIGFDAFLNRNPSNNNNNNNNKRKKSASKKEEKSVKKMKNYSMSEEEDDDLVIMPSTTTKKVQTYDHLFRPIEDPDKNRPFNKRQITDPSVNESLNRAQKLKDTIAQTQKSLRTSFEFRDDDEDEVNESPSNVVKLTINYVEKNRQFMFAVKKLEKFELLAEKLSSILGCPVGHIQFKLYNEVIELPKCPNDYDLMDNEKLMMTVKEPPAKPQPQPIQKIILEEEEEEYEDDEYKKELDRLISDATSNNNSKPKDDGPKKISLHVSLPGQNKHKKFKILPTDNFAKLIDAIYKDTGNKIRLQFEGEIIDPNSCPQDYDLEGGEQIDGKF